MHSFIRSLILFAMFVSNAVHPTGQMINFFDFSDRISDKINK